MITPNPTPEGWVVTVTPTIMDGQVVRWYRNLTACELAEPALSASRNGVLVSGYLHKIPDHLLAFAREVHAGLARGQDYHHLATHEQRFGRDVREIREDPK